ncbi:hypothetical protein DMB65_06700 [Flavobacterium cheongpyeongense]|uniref:Uncharacterized protein n=1 Tax=Flavobacterium cheongpyeongense TaxID=2212651 RepID=A0A2V4C611_9FLAO|nr:hypothetical protein [Flavobacterium cheongpyeongense]PXY41634.1 hypothetical protein DMB65_06700 [Flavobacterium cheongpyeongense]
MKNLLHLGSVFLLTLLASCASDQIEIEETNRANAVHLWHYNGDSAVLKKVIEQLKNGSSSASLERKLAKNDVLWNEAMFIYIENEKRILVPFLSEDKENVIGVLSLVKDPKGIAMVEDMTVRTRLFTNNNKLPFWSRGEWIGYFMALDKDILGIKNGNPGLKEKASSSNSQKITGTICQNVPLYDVCTTYYDCETDDGGESMYNCQYYDGGCYTVYGETCWEVPDNPNPEDPTDPGDDYVECSDIDINSILYDQVANTEFLGSTFISQNSNTTAKNLSWRIKVGDETYVKSIEKGVLKQVSNINNPYQWQSLTHQTLSLDSSEMFVVTTVESHTGTETLGLYNAIMDLSFHMKCSIICRGMPFADNQNYTAQRIFTISDFGLN